MKKTFLIAAATLLVTTYAFSQTVLQKKANSAIQKNLSTKVSAATANGNSTNQDNNGNAAATLSDEYFSITNETGKAANIRWSCSLYDQNNKQVAGFQDNNQDKYSAGSEVSNLKMQNINTARFGDFSTGGRLHIIIESRGNEIWKVSFLKLTLDFLNPGFTQNMTWKEIDLSGGQKEIDLFFKDAAQSPTVKYDLKANKAS